MLTGMYTRGGHAVVRAADAYRTERFRRRVVYGLRRR